MGLNLIKIRLFDNNLADGRTCDNSLKRTCK